MRQQGFTLVELLLSAALLLVLLGALGALYVSTTRAYETNRVVTAASGQLRSAVEAIQRDVGQAGFTGRDIGAMDGLLPLSADLGTEVCLDDEEICPIELQELTVRYVADAEAGGLRTVSYSVAEGMLMQQIDGGENVPLAEEIAGLDLVGYVMATGNLSRAHLSPPAEYTGLTLRLRYLQGGAVRSETFTAAAQ